MNNKKICPNCGNEMKLATYFSGSATGQIIKKNGYVLNVDL